MKRLINIYTVKNKKTISGFTNVEINSLNDIINYSTDHIFCSCLNHIESEKTYSVLGLILEKIRPGGYCTLSLTDMKQICRAYYNNALSDDSLLQYIKDHKAILSYQNICDMVKNISNVSIVQTNFADNYINVVIQRTGL